MWVSVERTKPICFIPCIRKIDRFGIEVYELARGWWKGWITRDTRRRRSTGAKHGDAFHAQISAAVSKVAEQITFMSSTWKR